LTGADRVANPGIVDFSISDAKSRSFGPNSGGEDQRHTQWARRVSDANIAKLLATNERG